LTKQHAAQDWDLPLEAVEEIVRYCEENASLIMAGVVAILIEV
jgi:hypothetical protein